MTRVVVSDIASQDQADILLDLTANAGVRTAAKYESLFSRRFDLLTDFPGIGAPRPGLGPLVRIGIVLPYIIIYEFSEPDDTVTIFRILHGRRNITRAFLEPEQ